MTTAWMDIRWRLIYADGWQVDEAPQGSTIMERRSDPIELHLIDPAGRKLWGEPIPAAHKPIFYRVWSADVKLVNGSAPHGFPTLDATVFGFGREEGGRMNGKLWMWADGAAVDCPEAYVGRKAVELQLAA